METIICITRVHYAPATKENLQLHFACHVALLHSAIESFQSTYSLLFAPEATTVSLGGGVD